MSDGIRDNVGGGNGTNKIRQFENLLDRMAEEIASMSEEEIAAEMAPEDYAACERLRKRMLQTVAEHKLKSQPVPSGTQDEREREIREKWEKACEMCAALCQPRGSVGSREWMMSIPVRMDDPDVVITDALDCIPVLLSLLDAERKRTAEAFFQPEIPKHLVDQMDNALDKAQSVGAFKMLKNAEAALGRWLWEHRDKVWFARIPARTHSDEAWRKRVQELQEHEDDEAKFMAKHGVLYNCTFIDGWAKVLDERDELRDRVQELEGALRKLFKAETDPYSSHEEMVEALAEAERVLKGGGGK